MYEAIDDPYCYPGTSVLKNRLDLRNKADLEAFEAMMTAQRADEPLPMGGLDCEHYRSIHRHLFQDIFDWAGEFRTVRVSKGNNMFCYPENIATQMRGLFEQLAVDEQYRDLTPESFAEKAAHFFAELNAIHSFREGNGRTQNVFLSVLADRAGHPVDFKRLNPPDMLKAMIASFAGDERPLASVILQLMPVR